MLPTRVLLATALVAAAVAAQPHVVAAQTTMSPPPSALGGKQPMSNTATNIGPSDTRTTYSPSLPAPPVDENAPPAAFLDAARNALAAGRTGEAQEALERAESRALDRSVKPSQAGEPSQQSLVTQIANARHMLASGDRTATLKAIETAAANPEANARAQ